MVTSLPRPPRRRPAAPKTWSVELAKAVYGIDAWGRGYFSVNSKGHLTVGPEPVAARPATTAGAETAGAEKARDEKAGDEKAGDDKADTETANEKGKRAPSPPRRIDLKELVDEVRERGIGLPLLVRFSEVLRARIDEIHGAFYKAMADNDYRGAYRGVYPIKVNQNRLLVEDLVKFGRPYHFGLEAGSKPELLAVVSLLTDPDALIVCNGYKDEEYVETALLASRLGPKVILVAEKPTELRLIADVSKRTGIRPVIGVRARLSTRGSGHWEASGGDRSKFGLGARELLETVGWLREHDLLDCLELLHFHLGSQISSIRNVKAALREGGWLYVNLVRMGAPLLYFDAGGGLGVDYDGSQTDFVSSMNYSLQEYANDVVSGLAEVCEPAGVEHPTIITESGRATVAHHAVLIAEVVGVGEFRFGELPETLPDGAGAALRHMLEAYEELTPHNLRETYHDVQQYREDCLNLFNLGLLTLEHRVLAEDIFWAVCRKARDLVRGLPYVPPELQNIEASLADTYFCNFSLFQSLPDAWAIDQLFPVVPIHRLGEQPTRRGTLADMTCDSDGKIDRFVRSHAEGDEPHEVRKVLELHEPGEETYDIAICLVGAYQEILGDLHNLFGDTNTVHVATDDDGGYRIDHVVAGDTVNEVLAYVGYRRNDLVARVRRSAEKAIKDGRLARDEMRQLMRIYEAGLAGYTYLERD